MGRVLPVLLVGLCTAVAWAGPNHYEKFDQQILGELAAIDAAAADTFKRANEARDQDPARAAQLYQEVERKVPTFDHAFRRHGGVLLGLKRSDDGLALIRHALELNDSPENQAAVAGALIMRKQPTPGELDEAWRLIGKAAAVRPDDPFVQSVMCQAALQKGHEAEFRSAAARLRVIDPDTLGTLYFGSLEAAADGRWGDAFGELERAHARGLTDADYANMRARLDEAAPFWWRWLRPLGLALAAWMAGLLALLVLGLGLSAATLRACRRPVMARDGRASGLDAQLRRLYAGVLWLCGVYFYLSLPLAVLSVAAFALAVFLLVSAAGFIPIKLILLLGLIVVGTVAAGLRVLFVRRKDADPGERVDLTKHPRLRALLDEVAARIGTRAVDAVYLVPGCDVAVIERGGTLAQLRGATERCLILGVGVLREFPLSAFQAVLAHEYGHFVNRDTAGGRFALAVRRSLHAFAVTLVRSGAAGWYNPAWWFVVAYERVFLRISLGASRLQEVLADRWAAAAYGAEAFEAGLRHVIAAEARFDAHVQATLREKLPIGRLYRLVREADSQIMTAATTDRFGKRASPYDSHPSPADRIAYVRALPLGRATASVPVDAWSLFSDREAVERAMTETIRRRAADRGIELPVASDPPEPSASVAPQTGT